MTDLTTTYTLFAEEPPKEAPKDQQQPGPMSPLFLLMLIVLFMVVVVMPAMNRRQRRDQEALATSVKRGAKVLLAGGIVGTIVSMKDGEDEIVVRSEDTKLRVKRSSVVSVIGTDEAEAAKQS